MNILLISNNYVVINNGRCYCSANFYHILKRFSYLGTISLAALARDNVQEYVELDFISPENVLFIKKRRVLPSVQNIRILDNAIKDCDLVIGYNPCVNAESSFWLAKKHGKKYMTYLVACVWGSLWYHSIGGKLCAPLRYLSVKYTTYKSDYVLYVTKEFLQNRYPNKNLNLGCSDVQINCSDDSAIYDRLALLQNRNISDTFNIVTTGAVYVKYKGQRFVIKALGLLKRKNRLNYHYYLIGGGDSTKLQNLARKYNVEDQVTFLGIQSLDQVVEILDKMDIYIQPSLTEGLPRSVVEAMSRGLLCLGTNVGAIPELLEDKFLFAKKSATQIANMLESLDIPLLRSECFKNVRVAEEYDNAKLDLRRNCFFDNIINDINKQ